MSFSRVFLVILDACGIGELSDAASYGDSGAATLPNVAESAGGLRMPTCAGLGLGNVAEIKGVLPTPSPLASCGRMAEASAGKDSTTGHWEIAGLHLDHPFPVFPDGFPSDLVSEFEKQTGVSTIGNVAASGTDIIKDLGPEHLQTGALILYTSADSVFQLAAHEAVCSTQQLYEHCQTARELCTGDYGVGRVIARPFTGEPGYFVRTAARKDFSLAPPSETVLDLLEAANRKVFGVGKIWDLFAGRGITDHVKTTNNSEVMVALRQTIKFDHNYDMIMANCIDFDQLWGHRNDETSFASGLEDFDAHLGEILPHLRDDDLIIFTADHGCDPTLKESTDHTREYVPLIVYSKKARVSDLGTRETFADIAVTIAEIFQVEHTFPGKSFLPDITHP